MSEQIKKRGRPIVGDKQDKRLPDVRVSENQLSAYKRASERENKTFSGWVRDVLDKASK